MSISISSSSCASIVGCSLTSDTLKLQGLVIQKGLFEIVADRNVTLQDSKLELDGPGVQVRLTCLQCGVRIERTGISGRQGALAVRGASTSLIDDSDLRALASDAVVVRLENTNATLHGTTLSAPGDLSVGLNVRGGTVALIDVKFEIRGTALYGNGADFVASGVSVRCAERGLQLYHVHRVELTRTDVEGCTDSRAAVEIANSLEDTSGVVSLANVAITNSVSPIHVSFVDYVRVANATFVGNSGPVVVAASNLWMRDTEFLNGTAGGLVANVNSMEVERARFVGNSFAASGGNVAALEVREYIPGTIPNLQLSLSIHNSTFQDNRPFAVRHERLPVLDATNNYWGSPLGPSPWATPDGRPLLAGDAIAVQGFVQTTPFLRTPP